MILPEFTVDQDADFVSFDIRCPYIKTQDVELDIDGCSLRFYARPYFLSLELPGQLIEDGRESASYNVDQGRMKIQIPKANPGEHFADLQLLTQLMKTKTDIPGAGGVQSETQNGRKVLIQELDPVAEQNPIDVEELIGMILDRKDDLAYKTDQLPISSNDVLLKLEEQNEDSEIETALPQNYGFCNRYQGVFRGFKDLPGLHDLIQLEDPEQRNREFVSRKQRLELENLDFDEDRYMMDYMERTSIQECLDFKAWWQPDHDLHQENVDSLDQSDELNFKMFKLRLADTAAKLPNLTEKQFNVLKTLSKRTFLFAGTESLADHYLSLLSILFGIIYEHRTTLGDYSVESCWTICRLSPTLSWFHRPVSLQDLLLTCIRRALIYPIYCNYDLALLCVKDLVQVLRRGKEAVLRLLLDAIDVFLHHEEAWRISKVWLEDFAIWVQTGIESDVLLRLAAELSLTSSKSSIDGHFLNKKHFCIGAWNLATLEGIAKDSAMEFECTDESEEETESSCYSSDDTSSDDGSEIVIR